MKMKKRDILMGLGTMTLLSLGACGKEKLTLVSEKVEAELGGTLDENVTSYVKLDKEAAKQASLDLSAVDMTKTGTYPASVTYGEQTKVFEVVVEDTTAPKVKVSDNVIVTAGTPLSAKDVLTEVTELSKEVTVTLEKAAQKEVMEQLEATEYVPLETESAEVTEFVEGTEQQEEMAETFVLGDVICTDDVLLFAEVGTYDVLLTAADASGNETEVTVSVTVGQAPEFSGIKNFTVTAGAEDIDYLAGVSAKAFNGNDLTGKIVCDSSNVKNDTTGDYEIIYTVTDADGFTAEKTAVVTVIEKKAQKNTGKTAVGGQNGNTGNATGTAGTGNTANNGNAGNAAGTGNNANNGNANNGGNTDNNGNSGSTGNTSGIGNSGSTGNSSNAGTGGSTGDSDNSGSTGNAGGTDQGGNAENGGNTDTGNTGSGNTSDNSGAPSDNWWESPEFDDVEDFVPQPGTGADDGTDLGGTSEWH